MSKEIKFRVQDEDAEGNPCWKYIDISQGEKWFPTDIICQFTGLKDKHGTEVYEGDILRKFSFHESDPEHNTEVKFMDGEFMCESPFGLREDIVWPNHHEVIGNIYENPDLLEKGSNE